MKKLLAVVFFLLISASAFGQGVDYFKGTFEEALDQAGKENKRVIVHFFSPY